MSRAIAAAVALNFWLESPPAHQVTRFAKRATYVGASGEVSSSRINHL
jgi:hypothetical protein